MWMFCEKLPKSGLSAPSRYTDRNFQDGIAGLGGPSLDQCEQRQGPGLVYRVSASVSYMSLIFPHRHQIVWSCKTTFISFSYSMLIVTFLIADKGNPLILYLNI